MMRPISMTLSSILNMSSMGWMGEMLEYRASSTSDVWFTIRTCLRFQKMRVTNSTLSQEKKPFHVFVDGTNLRKCKLLSSIVLSKKTLVSVASDECSFRTFP